MKTVLFRKEAESDLRSIIAYYDEITSETTTTILADIYRSIDQLAHYPLSGMQIPDRSLRRIVTIKFHFKIAYEVNEHQTVILGIFRYQDRET